MSYEPDSTGLMFCTVCKQRAVEQSDGSRLCRCNAPRAHWVAAAAAELAQGFSFGHGRDSYVTDEQRATVAAGYADVIAAIKRLAHWEVEDNIQMLRTRLACISAQVDHAALGRDMRAERDRLRAALARLVGVDGRAELEALEVQMRLIPAASEDKAASLDAIHALLATLDTPPTEG